MGGDVMAVPPHVRCKMAGEHIYKSQVMLTCTRAYV
jgi:hypothetical protein